MPFTSVCPKCSAKFRLLDKMFGCVIDCDECGKKYIAGDEVTAGAAHKPSPDLQVAEELRKLRMLLQRMMLARLAWNVIFLLVSVGLCFWVGNRLQGVFGGNNLQGMQKEAEPHLKKLQDLLELKP